MALDAIILDLDGTLVDTNGTHIESWQRVLERFESRSRGAPKRRPRHHP